MKIASLAFCLLSASAEIFFQESFTDGWEDRWVKSEWKDAAEIGKWETTEGKFYGKEGDKALKTTEDARFYGLSAKMGNTFDNKGKDLVIQYSVKNEQDIDCGGAYIKLLPDVDQSKFGGDSEYAIMFGPDICGYTKKTHVIFTYDKKEDKPTNYLHKTDVKTESDKYTHLYTLIVKADNTYEVQIDGEKVQDGKIADNYDVYHDEKINDPDQSKPKDWVDEKKIPDPEDKKPDGHDDIPKQIPDPEAKKPDDWDDEDDGEWEAPQIDNPEFKGEWTQKEIDNPDYKGEWEHPQIANPEYFDDEHLHNFCKKGCSHVGFELWQVKAGTLFDDIIVTDSVEEAKKFADETFYAKRDAEKKMAEKQEEDEKKKKEEEEAAKKKEEDEKKEDDKDGDDDEEEEKKEL
jgi:calreticulin